MKKFKLKFKLMLHNFSAFVLGFSATIVLVIMARDWMQTVWGW